jgi:hypothetical protein
MVQVITNPKAALWTPHAVTVRGIHVPLDRVCGLSAWSHSFVAAIADRSCFRSCPAALQDAAEHSLLKEHVVEYGRRGCRLVCLDR